MKKILAIQQKIIPEMLELLEKRYSILKNIYYNQPVGRRTLSQDLNLGERIIRTEVNFLKHQGLIEINPIGMIVTEDGEYVLEQLKEMIYHISGLSVLEDKIKHILKIKKVIVLPGDSEKDKTVQKEMGRACANYIKNLINDNSIISLTGGTSVAKVIDNFPKINTNNVLVVPARGGIGRDVEIQANTLTANLAKKIGATYRLLHVPDKISSETLESIINEPEIKDILDLLSKSDILLFGIGRADEMSKRRGMPQELIDDLLQKGAVAEAFGYYFNKKGEIIFRTPSIGINFNDVKKIKNIIAIAGGKNKAEAIIATHIDNSEMVLVTDEAAANEIITLMNKK
ncbi:Central glycolytic genes regulator [Caloramator mitchellensis]|uniref:Central glycolytic genes regulator n=1 Tax=Caloramator mitchellensis TaxID=908809 RepID=A0A0R3JWX0_CALMK|nr:sugar-binding domain-containing protein [Caloramator mitchellensis]KRQ88035.1 Central glycolytic genes regulator [Caloramator mitchellensis]